MTGTIFLRVTQTIEDVQGLNLEFKGGSKQSFKRFWTEMENEDGEEGGHHVEKSEKLKKAKKFLGYKNQLCQLPRALEPGDYQIRFSCTLPGKLPSSFYFKDKKKKESPKAKVKYFLKAMLVCDDSTNNMVYKQVLSIREKPEAL